MPISDPIERAETTSRMAADCLPGARGDEARIHLALLALIDESEALICDLRGREDESARSARETLRLAIESAREQLASKLRR